MPKPSKAANRKQTQTQGRANLARWSGRPMPKLIAQLPPELLTVPDNFWSDARVVMPVTKQAISIRLDTDVIEWFGATGDLHVFRTLELNNTGVR